DVAQAVAPRRDLDEGPEVLDRGHLALVDLADADLLGQGVHVGQGGLGAGGVHVRDVDRAVVLDVQLGAGLLLDGLDGLAAGADQQADLVGVDLGGQEARGVVGDLDARLAQGRAEHVAEDVAARLAGLLQRVADDLLADAVGLQVELDAGDAAAGAGDLEVHVAVVVLVAHDVGQEDVLLALLDQADGDAGHRVGDGHAGVHQRQRAAADRRHARGAVGLLDVADQADGVGELLRVGQDRLEAALGQGAVADLAPAGAADAAALADAVGREVVVEHELLGVLLRQPLDALLVAGGAQRRRDDGLRLAALEQRRAVDARPQADLAVQRPDLLGRAAVDALALADQVAHH